MKYVCLLIFILLPFSIVIGQEIQEYSVYEFGGGLVTSFKNSRLQDNMETVLIDYDIQDGVLVRRQGSTALYREDDLWADITKLIPYYVGDDKSLLIVKRIPGYARGYAIPDSSANLLVRCIPADETCSTLVDDFVYYPYQFRGQPYNISTTIINDRLIIASTKTEMSLYTPDFEFPARPLAPGQPEALAIDSNGNLDGTYIYKYAWIDETAADTSFFSPRSWPVNVSNGKTYLRFETMTDTTVQDKIIIFRKHSDSTKYKILVAFSPNDTASVVNYIDNIAEGSLGAAVPQPFGWDQINCAKEGPNRTPIAVPSPVTITFNNVADGDTTRILRHIGTLFDDPLDSLKDVALSYAMAYVDSAGRTSHYSAISCDAWTTLAGGASVAIDTGFTVSLTNIPVPIDSGIVLKIIVRKLTAFPYATGSFDQASFSTWRRVGLLNANTTTLNDLSASSDSGFVRDNIEPNNISSSFFPDPEKLTEDDSLLSFQPSAVIYHGSRLWAIGNPDNRNRIYYSDFGRPTTIVSSAFLAFPSREGDWIVDMVSMSNEEMIIFMQNSIYGLKGLTFYQFFADKVAVGVGLSAPRTLSRGAGGVFFVHKTGIYRMGQPIALSIPIQNSVDSVKAKLPYSFGTTIGNEYWWSVNGKTYIYSDIPTPHWKTYSMNIADMVLFDTDTLNLDYETGDYVIAMNDSLYQWGDCDSCTTDGGTRFYATYQSKAFLDNGMNREKIFYLDIDGSGNLTICDGCAMNDSLHIAIMDKLGTDTLFNDTVYIDFSDNKKDRIIIGKIVKDCTVGIKDFGGGDYRIEGYVIGWVPWDGGRMQ